MTPKLRKRILLLILSLIGGSVISSIVATEVNSKVGTLKLHHSIQKELNNFISSSNTENGQTNNLTPISLVTELAKNPNSIPLLMSGFATQVAKSIFDGKLYTKSKYNQLGKSFAQHLKGIKAQTDKVISAKRKSATRVKKIWVTDEEKYLFNLKEFILSKIDLSSIDSYYQMKEHELSSIRVIPQKAFPFIGFLMSAWISKYKAGNYIHELLPYSNKFQNSTKELYSAKFKNVKLPDQPDFYFPDFDPEGVDKFQKAIELWEGGEKSWLDILGPSNGRKEEIQKEIREKSAIHFISSSNTAQKNLALQYLTLSDSSSENTNNAEGLQQALIHLYKSLTRNFFKNKSHSCQSHSEEIKKNNNFDMTKLSDLFLDLKRDPLKLFCINKTSTESTEFVIHQSSPKNEKSSKSRKIIFWRDDKGFNILFPVKYEEQKKKEKSTTENISESKNSLINSFKSYIRENFSYLLLKYYLFIKGCKNGHTHECCEEIISNLVSIWELSRQLTNLNDTLKVWDSRTKNNSNLKMVDYSQNDNYRSKLGTISLNPPNFLEKFKNEEQIQKISSSIKTHLEKIASYFNGGAQNQGKKVENSELTAKQKNGSGKYSNIKYWTFNESEKPAAKKECMKNEIAEYLLEKIHSFELLKKYLLLPISFEKMSEVTSNTNSQVTTDNSKLEKILSEDYKKFFNLENGSGRSKRNVKPVENKKLIDLLTKAIEKELVISNLKQISDTFLFKIVSKEKNESPPNFETIKNWLTISNILNKPLRADNTLEKSKLRLLITSIFLMENSLREYREVLKSIVKRDFFGSYVYSLSWNRFCIPEEAKNSIQPIQNASSTSGNGNGNGKTSFWTPIKLSDSSSSQPDTNQKKEWHSTLDPRNCIRNQDRYSVSSIKNITEQSQQQIQTENGTTVEMMGYKGSISKSSQLQLPGNLYEQILDFLLKEGYIKIENIKSQIELIKTNRQFSDFIKQLTKSKSSIGWAFELPDYRTLKEDLEQSKRAEALEWFGLNQKKELLKKFIDKHWTPNSQLAATAVSSESTTTENSNNKKSFQGLMWNDKEITEADQKSYIFSTKDENEGSAAVYLIQFTADDLKNEETFQKFISEKLTPDMLIQDIVKKALNPGLQSKAINHYLMRGTWATGDKVYNLNSNDYYLKDQFLSFIL